MAAVASTVVVRCAEEIARAMREEHITDPQGRRVRVKHVATVERNGRQADFGRYADGTARPHGDCLPATAEQIVGDCRQLKWDVDSYNQNHNRGEDLQMVFDFTLDLEEIEALAAIA